MHLLVIEDDPRLGRLLKRLLEDDRHVVELAVDGENGLEIAEDAPGIECVILDIGLPDISGLEVARRLRAAGSTVTILMLTARDTVGDRVWPGWRSRHSSSENSRGLRSTSDPSTVTRRAVSSSVIGPTTSFGSVRRPAGVPRRESARSRADNSSNANGLTR